MAYTKECLGATDAQMGNVRPDNTSALMVLQNASEVPLENTRAGLHEWVEDIGAILLDMMGTYYGLRPVVIDHEVRQFDFSVFKHLWLNVSVDVGATTYYSEIAAVQTLDNLRRDGTLSVIEYLERMPDKLITRKQELIDSLKQRLGAEAAAAGNTSPTTDVVPPPSQGTRPTAVAVKGGGYIRIIVVHRSLVPDHGNDKGQIDGCIGAAEEGSGEACKAQKNNKAEKQREIQKGETLSEGSDEKLKNTPGEIGYDEDIGAYADIAVIVIHGMPVILQIFVGITDIAEFIAGEVGKKITVLHNEVGIQTLHDAPVVQDGSTDGSVQGGDHTVNHETIPHAHDRVADEAVIIDGQLFMHHRIRHFFFQ
jgi:hypothetical protein